MKKITVVCVLLVCMACGFSLYGYDQNAATKFSRGVTNGATCWVEVPRQIYVTAQERDPFTGLVYGSAKGVYYTLLRGTSGVYDAGTFLVPPYDEPLTDYEFVFQGWE